jgi:hypothetical protein
MQTTARFTLACIALALSLYGAGMASAQEFRATITGRVTDPNGLVVPGATVTAANSQTGEVAVGTTTTEGVYTIPFLRPGVYTVSAELSGFRKVSQPNVRLEVGQTSAVNFQLPLGELSEDITVSAESPLLETSKADRGLVIDNERVTELPLNARNPFMLSYLTPGITYNGPAIYQRPFDNGAIADWSINGGQNRNNEFLLDGAPNNSIQGGNNIAYVPPVDSVQEQGEQSREAESQARSVRVPDRRACDQEQDVLHVQLRGLRGGDAESGDLHRPGRRPAQGGFQQPARCAGTSDHDLRSEHGAAREWTVGARSVSGQCDSGKPHRSDGAALFAVFPAAELHAARRKRPVAE